MKAKENKNGEEIIRKNFKDIIGKVYTPFDDKQIYSLALDKQFEEENKKVLNLLNSDFDIQKCEIGQNPSNIFN